MKKAHGLDSLSYVYLIGEDRKGEQVSGLGGLTYGQLIELAGIASKGYGDGMEGIKWPYIKSVTNHWFYNDIDFSSGVYRKAKAATKVIDYDPDDDGTLSGTGINIKLHATFTAKNGVVYQVCEPEATGPNQTIKDIFTSKYYKYDGTDKTAAAIYLAKKGIKTLPVFDETIGMPTEFITTEKKEVNLKEDKANALAAFAIVENMHTEAADYIYRNLKDLVYNLNYFTKDELTETLKDVMLWPIETDNKNESWTVKKSEDDYGIIIKNVAGKSFLAPENGTITQKGDTVTIKFTTMSDETEELLKYIFEKDYKEIDKDILVGMSMKIKGINLSKTGKVSRGDVIGTAAGDVTIVINDIDKSVVDDVETYMRQKYNIKYEEIMKAKKTLEESYKSPINLGDMSSNPSGSGSNNGATPGTDYDPNKTLSSVSEIQQYVYDFLIGKGYTKAGTCAIMGVISKESGWNLGATNSSDGGFGLLQWTNVGQSRRRSNLETWCRNNGYDVRSTQGQMEFFDHEIQEHYSLAHNYAYPVYETLTTRDSVEECLTMFFCHDEAGTNVPISSTYIYAGGYSTQQFYDARLTEAMAFYNYFD